MHTYFWGKYDGQRGMVPTWLRLKVYTDTGNKTIHANLLFFRISMTQIYKLGQYIV